jgi:hypothetical protein
MAKKKAYVFTFGRFQPPTTGHEKLINTVVDHAKKIGADHGIYTSQRSDANRPRAEIKDPLEYGDKIKFLKKMFPQANIVKGGAEISTFMDVLYELQKKGYTTVHMVVGGDRIPGIRNTVKPYLNSDDEETALNFEEFKLINAGKRDPEATGVEGMSGSKLRALVKDNNFKEFKKGMPSGFSGARELFDALKKGLEPMKKGKKIEEKREIVREVSPPDEESERFIKKSKASFKDRYGENWASYLYGTAWKMYNKRHGLDDGEDEEMKEETLQEGGVKGALEDYMYSIPKAAIEELRPVMKQKASASKFGKITKILKKHGFSDKFMGSFPANVVNDYYDTFFGELAEGVDALNEGGMKGALEDWLYDLPKTVVKDLKTKFGSILKKAHYGGMIMVNDPDREKIRQYLISKKVKPLLGDKNHAESTSAILMSFWTFHGDLDESVELDEGSYVHSSAELKAAIKGSQEEIKSLTAKLKMFKKIGLSKESIEKIEDQIQFWQDNLADAEEQLKGMKESHEIQEANENIKKVKKMGFQTLYQFGGKYYTVSTSPMADETAIFNSDKNGDVKDYREIWSERERVSHDYAIKDYIDNKFKAFGVQVESLDLDEATIPRDAQVVDRNKEEKTVTLKWHDGEEWQTAEVPEDEVPGFYDRAADPMKQRKTDRFGNIMKTPAKGAEKKTEKAMAANKKDAEEILAIFKKKPMKTPITIIGTKWGKSEEYEMVVMKRMYQGDEVFVVKSSGRFVELRPSAAGLQVIDQKTKKILLDKGKDAVW